MAKAKMSDEAKFLMVIIVLILSVPLLFYFMSASNRSKTPETEKEKETQKSGTRKSLTVLVTEAQKRSPGVPTTAQAAREKVRDAIKQGNYSTARIEVGKIPKGSPEYRELLREMVASNRKGRGVMQIDQTAKTPLRYIDASSRRDRKGDAVYIYLVDNGDGPSPWFCAQTFGGRLDIRALKVKGGGKAITIGYPTVTVEKIGEKVAEFYDAPLNRESYQVVRRIVAAGKSELVFVGRSRTRTHKISEEERKAMIRILELYDGLGGSVVPFESR